MNEGVIHSRNRRQLMGQTFGPQKVVGDFRNGLLYKGTYVGVHFVNSNFGKVSFVGSMFSQCIFYECKMGMVNLSACQLEDTNFEKCDLDQSQFEGSILKNVEFNGGRAQYASFNNASMRGVKMDIDLHGADLRFGVATNFDFAESNLWGATINASCQMFSGKKFSARQLGLFVALLGESEGNDELRASLKALVPREVEMMELLSRRGA